LGNVKIGQTVLIVGVGGLGIHALQIAKLIGAKIAAADLRDEAINMAESFGAELLIDPKRENPYEVIMAWTEGKGVDVVLEGVGKKETFEWSLPSLKRGGRLIIMGYDPINPLPVSPLQMHYNEWIIMGARLSTKQELLEVIQLVEQGDLKPVVAKTIPLEEVNAGLEEVKKGGNIGRIVLALE
jgi:propanol-preferring alcohol dehydrogenase